MYPRKQELWVQGQHRVMKFCQVNGLSVPEISDVFREKWPYEACAYYRSDRIVGCLSKMAAIGVAGRSWSYPGYVVDRTPFGVLAHELGHHVDFSLGKQKGKYWSEFSSQIREMSGEPKLTNYCPNDAEWFAEMMRLFITNPDLLKFTRPRTFTLIRGCEIMPVEDRSWKAVLRDAPERTIRAAENKIREVHSSYP